MRKRALILERIQGLTLLLALAAGSASAQNELRQTFLADADAAKAAAEAEQAPLLAPRSWERGMDDFRDAEEGLQRGRNIEYVRSKAADASA